jgi:hypothetical protein
MRPWRDLFLQEIIRLEATGGRPLRCAACSEPADLRCQDCFGLDLFCQDCLVETHIRQPFHRVEVCLSPSPHHLPNTVSQRWNGEYFEKEQLAALGLVLQLGHPVGKPCPLPSNHRQLTVFDITGVHQVIFRYCSCFPEDPTHRRRQLFRAAWFPATLIQPHTVFTLRLLDFFHQLQSQNKTNLYDFYTTIVRLCDSAGLSPEIVSFLGSVHPLFLFLFICLLSSTVTTRSRSCIVCMFTCRC